MNLHFEFVDVRDEAEVTEANKGGEKGQLTFGDNEIFLLCLLIPGGPAEREREVAADCHGNHVCQVV